MERNTLNSEFNPNPLVPENFIPTDILKQATATNLPYIYQVAEPEISNRLPLVVNILGPSGSGKDYLINPLIKKGILNEALAATNRERRIRYESPNKYIWMRQRNPGESKSEYQVALQNHYDFVEFGLNNGYTYGLPLQSFEMALHEGTTVLVNDNKAARALKEKLIGIANFLCLFVVPDSLEELANRVNNRGNHEQRLREGIGFLLDAPNVAHFLLHNATLPPEMISTGAHPLISSMEQLITFYS